jgi:hypothetical protein
VETLGRRCSMHLGDEKCVLQDVGRVSSGEKAAWKIVCVRGVDIEMRLKECASVKGT